MWQLIGQQKSGGSSAVRSFMWSHLWRKPDKDQKVRSHKLLLLFGFCSLFFWFLRKETSVSVVVNSFIIGILGGKRRLQEFGWVQTPSPRAVYFAFKLFRVSLSNHTNKRHFFLFSFFVAKKKWDSPPFFGWDAACWFLWPQGSAQNLHFFCFFFGTFSAIDRAMFCSLSIMKNTWKPWRGSFGSSWDYFCSWCWLPRSMPNTSWITSPHFCLPDLQKPRER